MEDDNDSDAGDSVPVWTGGLKPELDIPVITADTPDPEEDHRVEDITTTHMSEKEKADLAEEAWKEIDRDNQAALKEKVVECRNQQADMKEFNEKCDKYLILGLKILRAGSENAPLVPESDYDWYEHPWERPEWATVECEIGDLVKDGTSGYRQIEPLTGAEREAALLKCTCQGCVREKDRKRRAVMMAKARRDSGLARDIGEDISIQDGLDGDEGALQSLRERLQIKPKKGPKSGTAPFDTVNEDAQPGVNILTGRKTPKRKSTAGPAKERAKKPRG